MKVADDAFMVLWHLATDHAVDVFVDRDSIAAHLRWTLADVDAAITAAPPGSLKIADIGGDSGLVKLTGYGRKIVRRGPG